MRAAAALAVLAVFAAPAQADFRFSSQRSLSAPDPFLPRLRRAPGRHGAERQIPSVNGALDAALLSLIFRIEARFGAKAVIVSGCRSPAHNAAVGGAPNSWHLSCKAADIRLPGVPPSEIRRFALALPERGGIGTYCGFDSVHVDVGPARQWHRPCGAGVSFDDVPFAMN
jgi:Peptidase M15